MPRSTRSVASQAESVDFSRCAEFDESRLKEEEKEIVDLQVAQWTRKERRLNEKLQKQVNNEIEKTIKTMQEESQAFSSKYHKAMKNVRTSFLRSDLPQIKDLEIRTETLAKSLEGFFTSMQTDLNGEECSTLSSDVGRFFAEEQPRKLLDLGLEMVREHSEASDEDCKEKEAIEQGLRLYDSVRKMLGAPLLS